MTAGHYDEEETERIDSWNRLRTTPYMSLNVVAERYIYKDPNDSKKRKVQDRRKITARNADSDDD